MQVIGVVLVFLILYALALAVYLLSGTGPAWPVVSIGVALPPSLPLRREGNVAFIAATKLKPK